MKKILAKKIILALTILGLIFPITFPINSISAAEKITWDNPQDDNPYKIQLTDALNSRLLVDVVSCTGAVDWASKAVTTFTKNLAKKLSEKAKKEAQDQFCKTGKKAAIQAVAAAYGLNITDVMKEINCGTEKSSDNSSNSYMSGDADSAIGSSGSLIQGGIPQVSDPNIRETVEKISETEKEIDKKRECLNGIAYTLAKNQLATMTKYTMNWVNTGFNGDPLYVQNVNSFMNNLTEDVVMGELNLFKGQKQYYPYGESYYRSVIGGYQSADNFKDSMKQNLSYYLQTGGLGEDTEDVIQKYSNNFGMGGWNGWLAFTQQSQNNPLGYQMEMSQYLADKQNQEIANAKAELDQGNGFLSQKKCVKYGVTIKNKIGADGKISMETVEDPTRCVEWKNVTPGSIIGAKVSTYLNSPERQLELADTINESLNILFSSLINTLRNEGLSGLLTSDFKGTNDSDNQIVIDPETGETLTTSSYVNRSVDLTKDLGNIYHHDGITYGGEWDAKNNVPKLYANIGKTNYYYNVKTAGNTEIIKDGYNGWEKGDRAFFDGENWQNWKCGTLNAKGECTNQVNPIKKRGIVQIQQDYLVAAKEAMTIMPGVMSKLGELDYCIPGPNPSWQSNVSLVSDAYTEYVSALEIDYTPKGGFLGNREYAEITSAEDGSTVMETYKSIFNKNGLWNKVKESYPFKSIKFTADLREGGSGWTGSYRDSGEKYNRVEEAIGIVSDLKEKLLKDLSLFKTKYAEEINKVYGTKGLMQKEYIENENTYEIKNNPAYLEMAQTGLNITKDIASYGEKINEAVDNYSTDIIEANTNIKKLNIIKDQVSTIIRKAQARRDENLLKILNEEAKRTGGSVLTETQYKTKYAGCLEEENISFYEDTEILNAVNTGAEERCYDNLDNDLDGLVDSKDPDCSSYTSTNTTNGSNNNTTSNKKCSSGSTRLSSLNGLKVTSNCSSINSESLCLSSYYTSYRYQYNCKWE